MIEGWHLVILYRRRCVIRWNVSSYKKLLTIGKLQYFTLDIQDLLGIQITQKNFMTSRVPVDIY